MARISCRPSIPGMPMSATSTSRQLRAIASSASGRSRQSSPSRRRLPAPFAADSANPARRRPPARERHRAAARRRAPARRGRRADVRAIRRCRCWLVDDHQRQRHRERRAVPGPSLDAGNRAAVELGQLLGDRQARARGRRARARRSRRAWRKRSKTNGRKSAAMPRPVSLTVTSTCELTRARRSCTLPPRGVNLIAFDSRFQTICCSRSASPDTGVVQRVDHRFDAHALGIRRRHDRGARVVQDRRQVHRLDIQAQTARRRSARRRARPR